MIDLGFNQNGTLYGMEVVGYHNGQVNSVPFHFVIYIPCFIHTAPKLLQNENASHRQATLQASCMCLITPSAGQNTQGLAVLDDIVVYLIQGVVLELEPFPDQLLGQNAGPRLLQELIAATETQ